MVGLSKKQTISNTIDLFGPNNKLCKTNSRESGFALVLCQAIKGSV
jgi:hypothetical protein